MDNIKVADVNKDDDVDSSDVSRILTYYAASSTGKKPELDIQQSYIHLPLRLERQYIKKAAM